MRPRNRPPRSWVCLCELVNQRGRLQRVPGSLAAEVRRRHRLQLRMDGPEQLIQRLGVASARRAEQTGDRARRHPARIGFRLELHWTAEAELVAWIAPESEASLRAKDNEHVHTSRAPGRQPTRGRGDRDNQR